MDANEVERLRALYGGLADEELLRLVATRDGLTAVAQQAVDAEMQERGLEAPVVEEPVTAREDASAPEDDPWLPLHVFGVSTEAELAYRKLSVHEVPARLDFAERRLEENGPVVRTNWLQLSVPFSRKLEAQQILRREMNLFPAVEHDYRDAEESAEEDNEVLFLAGEFEDPNDAELAKKALGEAGIWFRADVDDEVTLTTIMVKPEDAEAALAAVEGGFAQADD